MEFEMEGEKSTTKPVPQYILKIILVFTSLPFKNQDTENKDQWSNYPTKKIIWACHPPSPNGEKGLRNLLEIIWKYKTCSVLVREPQTAWMWSPAAHLETEAPNSSNIQCFHLLIFCTRKAADICPWLMLSSALLMLFTGFRILCWS